MELQGRFQDLDGKGQGLAAVSYDPPAVLKAFTEKYGVTYPLLSDAGSEVIKRYGLLNTTVDPANKIFGVPFPGTFILDAQGRVVERFFEQAYQERVTAASVAVRSGEKAAASAARKSTQHLTVESGTSDAAVAPGNRFSIVLDVTPRRNMHVYAPPQENYKPVSVSIKEQAGVTVHEARYPAGQEFFFKPLNERVSVYMNPFRIVQDVTVSASKEMQARAAAAGAELQVDGVFSYQACDDEVCYFPENVPLSWTVALKPLNRP